MDAWALREAIAKLVLVQLEVSNTVEEEQNVTVGAEKKRKRLGRKW